MLDVLLINAPVKMPEVDRHARMGPPLGLAYMAALLEKNDFRVEAIDMNVPGLEPNPSMGWGFNIDRLFYKLKQKMEKKIPRIVGISSCTESFPNASRIAGIAKEISPEIKTILGGPHVTFFPAEALEKPEVDVIVRNEGEFALLELARYFKYGAGTLDEIIGINFRRNGEVVSTPTRPFVKNLDDLPFPARHLFLLKLYPYPGNVITARGCPHRCIFCAATAMSGGKYRIRSPRSVVNELIHLVDQYRLQYFSFIDDTFTVFPDRTAKICDLIDESKLQIRWSCSSRVDSISVGMMERMAKSGCDNINFGIESASQEILDSVRKGITLKQVEDVVEWALKSGITPVCSFMTPHPNDTEETINKTKMLMHRLLDRGCHISMSLTTPFPGTYLFNHADKLGVKIESENWEDFDCGTPVISTKNLSQKDIYKLYADMPEFIHIPY
jgi:anaerobic magnesium-protoporphyrin IX monomethyl ester cyclase